MKPMRTLVWAMVLALSLTACGGQTPAESDSLPESQTPETAPAQTTEEPLPAVAGDFYAVRSDWA